MKRLGQKLSGTGNGLTILMMIAGIVFCANTYGQTSNTIEVDRDSLANVFVKCELCKAENEMLKNEINNQKAIIQEYDFKVFQLEKVITNTNGIVKAQDSIIASKDIIISIEKKNGKQKAKTGFLSGFGIGALIMALIL